MNQCVPCRECLALSHILVHCAEYINIRDIQYHVNNPMELFQLVDPANIMFFKRCKYYVL